MENERLNCGTYISAEVDERFRPGLMAEAWARAHDALNRAPHPEGRTVAVIAAPMIGYAKPHLRFVAVGSTVMPTPCVVGGHDHADLLVPNDHSVSLRHAIVLISMGPHCRPVIRILNLRSPTGLKDLRGFEHESIVADGPLALVIGNTALFVLPDVELPPARFDDVLWTTPASWIPKRRVDEELTRRSDSKYSNTMLSLNCSPRLNGHGNAGAAQQIAARIRLRDDRFKLLDRVDPDLEMLRCGVLLGRYSRCDSSRFETADLPQSLSRVHALVIEVDSRVLLFDTSSTFGIWDYATGAVDDDDAFPIAQRKVFTLDEEITRFFLGPDVLMEWEPVE